jgi:hypothetical protein
MNKNELLKYIAVTGYDVGFGAKKHFASYDIIEKGPGWLGFVSLVGAVYSLFVPFWATAHVAAVFVVFGVVSLYIGFYGSEKARYEEAGRALTKGFHELHALCREVKSMPDTANFEQVQKRVRDLHNDMLTKAVSKQVFLSDWYAHYKFFWIAQVDWIHEVRPFSLWRDKIPLTAYLAVVAIVVGAGVYAFNSSIADIRQTPKADPSVKQ